MAIENNIGEWIECIVDSDYEIFSQYPHPIRRKGSDKIVSEHIDSDGYVICALNSKSNKKHRIIASQFIPNPLNLPFIDHINHDRADNRVENLRWVTQLENMRNRSSSNGVTYEYIDELSNQAIEITNYGDHNFEFYYYDPEDDNFYYYTGVNYRKLHINIMKTRPGTAYVCAKDTHNKNVNILLNRFKKLYGLL